MSKRKQKLNPITYKEKPPLWMQTQEPSPKKAKEEQDPLATYDEILFVEAEEEENRQQQELHEEVLQVYDKDKTKEFVRKEMGKLITTIEQLIDYDDHSYVVNFVLEMSGTAKKKLWELQSFITK